MCTLQQLLTRLAIAVSALVRHTSVAFPVPVTPVSNTICRPLMQSFHLNLLDFSSMSTRGIVLAEDGILALSQTAGGNANLLFSFDQCDLPALGFTSGTSRNSGGSMGAPIEYFGHLRLGDAGCLTAVYEEPEVSAWDDDAAVLKVLPCAFDDDNAQLLQLFVLAISATETISVSFLGDRNSTMNLYHGPRNYWRPSPQKPRRHRPRPVLVTSTPSHYAMLVREMQ